MVPESALTIVDIVVHRPEEAVGIVLRAAGVAVVGSDLRLNVGFAVAVRVLHEPEVRRGADEYAALDDRDGTRQHQVVRKYRLLVVLPVVIRILKNGDLSDR